MKELICVICPRGCRLLVDEGRDYSVIGNRCPRGAAYGRDELTHPTRTVTSTVCCIGGLHPRCPVKTDAPIPKERMREAVQLLDGLVLTAPIQSGQVVVRNICETGACFITTRPIPAAEISTGPNRYRK